jgi:MoaA/NifB/PqqE/SkfB family radical SAM enzyme
MDIREQNTIILEYLSTPLRESLYSILNPKIELSLNEDGMIEGRGIDLVSSHAKGLIDYYCAKLNSSKVIARRNGANVYSIYHPPFPSPGGDKAIRAKIRDAIFKLRTPTTNTMAVTYKCQCNCVHCSANVKIDPNRKELTTDEWKRVIDEASDMGVFNHVFTGGEPCLRKDLPELIAHVTYEKGTAIMFSNGGLLKKRAKELADAGLFGVFVSVDDTDPGIHNRLRRTEKCFETAMEGAAAVRDLGILTGISTYATKEKIRDGSLEKLIDQFHREGFIEVTIFDPIPSGKWMRDTSFLLNEEERAYLRDLSYRYNKMKDAPSVIAQSHVNSPYGSGCFGGYFQVYTTSYGDVNPCDFNPISFGNVRDGGLANIWNKMTHHKEYRCRRSQCRMQNPEYRSMYIDPVPEGIQWPVPIEYFEKNGRTQSEKVLYNHIRQLRNSYANFIGKYNANS